jgi:hypothetical protein
MDTNIFGEHVLIGSSWIEFIMPLPEFPTFLIQVQNPYMEFGIIISNIMKGEVLFHLRNPLDWVGTIKFIHVKFGNLSPRRWRTPRGVGGLSMFIMRRLKFFWIWLNILTPEKLHQFVVLLVKVCGEFIVGGKICCRQCVFRCGTLYPPRFLGTKSEW